MKLILILALITFSFMPDTGNCQTVQSEQDYYNLANNFLKEGNQQEAINNFKKALELEPNDFTVNMALGTTLYKMGQLNTAIFYLKKAVEIKPSSLGANIAAGMVSKLLNNLSEAKQYLETANRIDPQNFSPYLELASIYLAEENIDKSMQFLEMAQRIKADDPVMYQLYGAIYIRKGQQAEARDSYQKARELYSKEGNIKQVQHLDQLLGELGTRP